MVESEQDVQSIIVIGTKDNRVVYKIINSIDEVKEFVKGEEASFIVWEVEMPDGVAEKLLVDMSAYQMLMKT